MSSVNPSSSELYSSGVPPLFPLTSMRLQMALGRMSDYHHFVHPVSTAMLCVAKARYCSCDVGTHGHIYEALAPPQAADPSVLPEVLIREPYRAVLPLLPGAAVANSRHRSAHRHVCSGLGAKRISLSRASSPIPILQSSVGLVLLRCLSQLSCRRPSARRPVSGQCRSIQAVRGARSFRNPLARTTQKRLPPV
jgi:hypothetical protein